MIYPMLKTVFVKNITSIADTIMTGQNGSRSSKQALEPMLVLNP